MIIDFQQIYFLISFGLVTADLILNETLPASLLERKLVNSDDFHEVYSYLEKKKQIPTESFTAVVGLAFIVAAVVVTVFVICKIQQKNLINFFILVITM